VDLRTAHRELTANALMTDQPSAFSAQQLSESKPVRTVQCKP
jgi:hypothetical protein